MSNLLNFALRQGANFLKRHTLQNLRCTVPAITHKLPVITAPLRAQSTRAAFDMSTNVTKDVMLFKYENPRFYNMLNFFGVCQFVFWTYLSHFAFTTLKDAPVVEKPGEELKWYQRINLGENKYKNGITICSFLIGYGILFAVWMFTLRSVRFLILRKGGQSVSFVTYGPFNRNRIMTVPLKCISAEESRELARVQLPIKVKNKSLYYVLDMRGEFRNPQLFDYTAGLKRRI
ncbi:transmembrane protein 223 [Drosophila nasuta]|uniref:Transmembrane protein 223 n=1 Tax=Drosophila albomicans TaxID=7291 RepID=A0A6P8XC87_DROAB|nr:transmembrane protein 223 [Drosophila albomicans]XP_060660039.1 transmembrane protein 223 [Drosophila nasuta]XP_060660040.1 transmembrane protein 223 [Drosophila nasuta]